MLELLALVILVAILFGVSLQNALIGIIIFSIGLTIVYVLVGLGKIGLMVLGEKYRQIQIAKTQKTKPNKKTQNKNRLSGLVAFSAITLWFISPIIVYILLFWLIKEWTINNPFYTMGICLLPFIGGILIFKRYALGLLQKNRK